MIIIIYFNIGIVIIITFLYRIMNIIIMHVCNYEDKIV